MGVCSAGGGDSLNNLFLDSSKGTAFPPGSQAADLPTPLQKCMAQPDPFSQECSPGKSQAPSRRHPICPDSLLPPSSTGLSLIPDSVPDGATAVGLSTHSWCWGGSQPWGAAGNLHPAAENLHPAAGNLHPAAGGCSGASLSLQLFPPCS